MDLFRNQNLPLSKRMMPRTLGDFFGQTHLVGKGKPITAAIENKTIQSMIFYGPPATGKTSLAEIISQEMNYSFVSTNATTINTDEIKKILNDAENRSLAGARTIVFVDEIHRLIKPKQDAFLSSLETGEVIMIGATTENPYFILQPALRSRAFIYEFKPHTKDDLEKILDHALKNDKLLSKIQVHFAGDCRDFLLEISGDARRLLNTLELAVLSKTPAETLEITKEDISAVLQNVDTKYSDEEGHYDIISAFIKSVRGSDPDAALYYLAFMIKSGEDPLFIARRLIILAAEDIGLAYPEALPHAVACYEAVERIGMPEGRIVLAETTILLAGVPKSNSAIMSIDAAMGDIEKGNVMNVPPYLRGSNYYGAEKLGRGIGYKYPHSFENHHVAQKYTEKPVSYYTPGELGFEKKISDWLKKLRSKDGE
jgi:putative ATPase